MRWRRQRALCALEQHGVVIGVLREPGKPTQVALRTHSCMLAELAQPHTSERLPNSRERVAAESRIEINGASEAEYERRPGTSPECVAAETAIHPTEDDTRTSKAKWSPLNSVLLGLWRRQRLPRLWPGTWTISRSSADCPFGTKRTHTGQRQESASRRGEKMTERRRRRLRFAF